MFVLIVWIFGHCLFFYFLLRYYCKIHFGVKVGTCNLRVQIRDFI